MNYLSHNQIIAEDTRQIITFLKGNSSFLFLVLISLLAFYLIKKILQLREIYKDNKVILELTPPANTDKTSYTTQQLFSVIHSLGIQISLIDKLLGKRTLYSFEIVSSHSKGIRYLLVCNKNEVSNMKRNILAYLPHVEVKQVADYLPSYIAKNTNIRVIEFDQTKHFAFPLKKQDMLYEHDPVAYITGMMTKLKDDELIAFQLVISPVKRKDTTKLSRMILRNEDVISYLDQFRMSKSLSVLKLFVSFFAKILQIITEQIQWVLTELTHDYTRAVYAQQNGYSQAQPLNPNKPARVLSSFEQEVIQSIQEKVNQPLFESSIRVFTLMKDTHERHERQKGFISSITSFSIPKYQTLIKKVTIPFYSNKVNISSFRNRIHSLYSNNSSTVLSVSEIGDLYHFPFRKVTQTENIVKVHSKELPAPLSLKHTTDLDVVFAKNTYGGETTLIGLTSEERLRHMYVIGATGTGKSTMLLSMITQDLKNGKGLCLIDPHGDLAETTINYIPEERMKDFIYFNPYDIKHPIGINLLERTPGLEEDESLIEKEFIAESVISLFRKVFSDAYASHPHRIEYILRNTIHTAFTLENPTLFTIFDLLNNPVFQKKVVNGLTDENLKNFWKYEFAKAGDFQKVKMVSPITARIGRFLFSPSAKRILEQEHSTINFDDIINKKKILICNLSKGNIGEDTSEIMGIMLLNKIQLAALKRSRMQQRERSSFYLYVDEFQNFATPSFVQMLSEARKYGLNLTLAEQSTSQQKDNTLVQVVLANTGTIVTFRSANPKDEEMLLPQFRPYVEYGEITNLPSFHFYMKTAAIRPEEPFSGITMPVDLIDSEDKRNTFIASSQYLYASKYTVIKKEIKASINNNEAKKLIHRSGLPA
jgi:hypothetical protein